MTSTPRCADATGGTSARTVALTGALTALACALALAEAAWLPALPVPGVRIGLANLATILALAVAGPRVAFTVSALRVALTGALAGGLGGPGFVMAAAGAVAAWAVMSILYRAGDRFSPVGWSAAGSVAHVAAQFALAAGMTGTAGVLVLAPISLALSLPCGVAIGCAAALLISRVPLTSADVSGAGRDDGAAACGAGQGTA